MALGVLPAITDKGNMPEEKPAKFDIARLLVWTVVLCMVLGLAHILYRINQFNLDQQERPLMARELLGIWNLQRDLTDTLNDAAKKYIAYYKLKPGHPLPPDTFYKEGDPTWGLLSKKEATQIVTYYQIRRKRQASQVTTFLTIGDKVPQVGEDYAYSCIMANTRIFPEGFAIYPENEFGLKRIREGTEEVTRKSAGNPPSPKTE